MKVLSTLAAPFVAMAAERTVDPIPRVAPRSSRLDPSTKYNFGSEVEPQRFNPKRAERRKAVRRLGIRQFKRSLVSYAHPARDERGERWA